MDLVMDLVPTCRAVGGDDGDDIGGSVWLRGSYFSALVDVDHGIIYSLARSSAIGSRGLTTIPSDIALYR